MLLGRFSCVLSLILIQVFPVPTKLSPCMRGVPFYVSDLSLASDAKCSTFGGELELEPAPSSNKPMHNDELSALDIFVLKPGFEP